jgi:hypothetical protein
MSTATRSPTRSGRRIRNTPAAGTSSSDVANLEGRPTVPENVESVTCDENLLARRRHQIEQFSIGAFEGLGPLPTSGVSDLPLCCAPVLDGAQVIGLNFWDLEPVGDPGADAATGELFAEDALWYVRDHPGTEILTSILYWIGVTLHFEERCAGPLEQAFVYRVLRDFPDAVDRMFAAVYRHHPGQLN